MTHSLSIVIPAFNEQVRLPETIRHIEGYLESLNPRFHELLIVDDGSTDGTVEAIEEFARTNPCIRILRNPGNKGKGYSVRHGMLEARGEWTLFSDADLSTPIEEFQKLWCTTVRERVEIAIGSRALDPSLIGVHQPGFRESAGKMFNRVMRSTIGLSILDTQCGFKLFRSDVARRVFSRQRIDRFGFDVEVLFIAQALGYRVAEVPVRWNHADGSKVGMFTGLHAFAELAIIRMNAARGLYR